MTGGKYKIGHSEDGGLFIGKNIQSVFHEHLSIAIVLSFSQPFEIIDQREQSKLYEVAMIPKGISYKLSTAKDDYTAFIHLDPFCEAGLALSRQQNGIQSLERNYFSEILDKLRGWFEDPNHSNEPVQNFLQNITSPFIDKNSPAHLLDSRVQKCIELIKSSELEEMNLEKAAGHVSLSPGRLYHLFKQETGVTFRQFLQHRKLVQSLLSLHAQTSFTEATFFGGFCDQPHFNKVFKKNFGIKPSKIKNS